MRRNRRVPDERASWRSTCSSAIGSIHVRARSHESALPSCVALHRNSSLLLLGNLEPERDGDQRRRLTISCLSRGADKANQIMACFLPSQNHGVFTKWWYYFPLTDGGSQLNRPLSVARRAIRTRAACSAA